VQARSGLRGGVRYWDGQFDDARLAVLLARTASTAAPVVRQPLRGRAARLLLREQGQVCRRARATRESGEAFELRAGCVVNATGVWVDALREHGPRRRPRRRAPWWRPARACTWSSTRVSCPASHALLVPRTDDGRVLFAVPWLGKTMLGTTDTPRRDLPREPDAVCTRRSTSSCASRPYLAAPRSAPTCARSGSACARWCAPASDDGADTKALSREHTVRVSRSGLVTVTGGKWTTYRAMAEDVLARCVAAACCAPLPPCATAAPAAGRCASRRPAGQRRRRACTATAARPRPCRRCRVPGAGVRERPAQRGHGALRRAPRTGAQRRGRAGAALALAPKIVQPLSWPALLVGPGGVLEGISGSRCCGAARQRNTNRVEQMAAQEGHAPTAGEYIVHHLHAPAERHPTAVVDFSVVNMDSVFFRS
jgi:hypothetical protein